MSFIKSKKFIIISIVLLVLIFIIGSTIPFKSRGTGSSLSESGYKKTSDLVNKDIAKISAGNRDGNVEIPGGIKDFLQCDDDSAYGYESVDLNEDGEKEFIISPWGSCRMEFGRGASGNGPIFVFQKIDNKWEIIGEVEGNSLTVVDSQTNGFYDISSYHHMSAIDGVETLYQYDSSYREISKRDVAGVVKKNYNKGITKYYIAEDGVAFNVYDGLAFKEYKLNPSLAPELFDNILQKIVIIYELKTDTQGTYYLITDNYSDHGGYATRQAIVYDLERNKILYESNDYLREGWYASTETLDNGDFHISYYHTQLGWGMKNKLKFDQYYSIDTVGYKVVSSNTKYKDHFKELLENLKDECVVIIKSPLASENEKLPLEQVQKEYGDDFECKIPSEGSGPTYKPNLYGNEGVLTPRKYFLYKNALEDIIRGKEVDLTLLEM